MMLIKPAIPYIASNLSKNGKREIDLGQAKILNPSTVQKEGRAQLDALALGLPWQRIGQAGVISVL